MQRLFDDLKRYVGFGPEDEQALRAVHARLAPSFPAVSEVFYARVLEHEEARQALGRGEKHVGQLKGTLVRWMNELFSGPWDEAYVERRARIGRVHVQIALPQQYMVSAMNVVRTQLRQHLAQVLAEGTPEHRATWFAIERMCDVDLALMLHTYREDLEARQARAERLATFGQLVGSIGHELRNPLGVIETSLYLLKSKVPPDERTQKHLDRISQQVSLANDIITQLLELIREKPLQRSPVAIAPLVEDAISNVARPAGCSIETDGLALGLRTDGDPTQLRQVLVNLVDNACYAAGEAGRVRIAVRRDGAELELTIDDSGPGIDRAVRGRLFEPLVTTKPRGIGLGLALVRRIVERHEGTISASSGPLGGARFVVRLPCLEAA